MGNPRPFTRREMIIAAVTALVTTVLVATGGMLVLFRSAEVPEVVVVTNEPEFRLTPEQMRREADFDQAWESIHAGVADIPHEDDGGILNDPEYNPKAANK